MYIGNFLEPKQRYLTSINLNPQIWEDMVMSIKQIIKSFEPSFIFTEELTEIYRDVLLYFLGNPQSKYDLNKGLYFYGAAGCGKSLILQNVFKQFTANLGTNSYRVVHSVDIASKVEKYGLQTIHDYVLAPNDKPIILYIDDFGAGNVKINHYGTVIDIYSELVVNRYPYFAKNGTLTHFSSNLAPASFRDTFDDRINSRMAEMVNIVFMPKIDYRLNK